MNVGYEHIAVAFFRLDSGREPVREWLREMSQSDRKVIGMDIKTLQFGWPLGMPLARKMSLNLWELRSVLNAGSARTFFTVYESQIVLLHGFIKTSRRTPRKELALATRRLSELRQ